MNEKTRITPRARRIAIKKGIDISALSISGTGYNGGICEKDILTAIAEDVTAVERPVHSTPLAARIAKAEHIDIADFKGSGVGGKVTKADVLSGLEIMIEHVSQAQAIQHDLSGMKAINKVVPYKGVRKIIGERLALSKVIAPHIYFTQKVDMKELLALRDTINAKQEKKSSVTDYIVRACVMALRKYPEMNASLVDDVIEEYANINIGIAVASPSGLIVPVVKNAQDLGVIEISKAASALFEKALDGTLTPDEYSGGTFTVSNLGMFGIENFTAIINQPEIGILAVSATKDEVVVLQDSGGGKEIAIRPLMNITLTTDHRVVDGLLSAQFIGEIKRLLESPLELLI